MLVGRECVEKSRVVSQNKNSSPFFFLCVLVGRGCLEKFGVASKSKKRSRDPFLCVLVCRECLEKSGVVSQNKNCSPFFACAGWPRVPREIRGRAQERGEESESLFCRVLKAVTVSRNSGS